MQYVQTHEQIGAAHEHGVGPQGLDSLYADDFLLQCEYIASKISGTSYNLLAFFLISWSWS